ncbi:histidine triad family protein [Cavenderia fasciculata]|uniref:Histidine triad family protein n=1 Tax=Cavenderia fasciculata TaxID=261658 RepID=F4PUB4_CACFS|nr:histidine triad family protein [Cavenderia fasciculata]EGG21829.1 histidine triad family protein [Cavenderia fasciculata]|eukprot:XP_004359679.1 histidine triad family protein [Cavenderia fasciculata]
MNSSSCLLLHKSKRLLSSIISSSLSSSSLSLSYRSLSSSNNNHSNKMKIVLSRVWSDPDTSVRQSLTPLTIDLEKNPFNVGRGLLDIGDDRISRKQVELSIGLNSQQLLISQLGLNPSFIQDYTQFIQLSTTKGVMVQDLVGQQIQKGSNQVINIGKEYSQGLILSFIIPDERPIHVKVDVIPNTAPTTSPTNLLKRSQENKNDGEYNDKDLYDSDHKTKMKKVVEEETTSTTSTSSTSTTSTNSQQQLDNSTIVPPKPKPSTSKGKGSWSDALLPYCDDPEGHKDVVVWYDDQVVLIKDVYPKSKYHFLMLPREHISNFKQLSKSHIPLLKKMYQDGMNYIKKNYPSIDIDKNLQVGFHAIPSMRQLHMHFNTKDYNTPQLKRKEHWQSFTTEFYIPQNEFIGMLETNNQITIDKEKMLAIKDRPLECPKCHKQFDSIPKVKSHHSTCC